MLQSLRTNDRTKPAEHYADNRLFGNPGSWLIKDNAFRRPSRPQDVHLFDFNLPLTHHDQLSASALTAQRMLLNIYEQEMVFLPRSGNKSQMDDFGQFYNSESRTLGRHIQPVLEHHLFDFLTTDIEVNDKWSVDAFTAYCLRTPEQ